MNIIYDIADAESQAAAESMFTLMREKADVPNSGSSK
jgi:hypothetical protein